MSYGLVGLSGTMSSSSSSLRSGGSVAGRTGGSSRLFGGRYDRSVRIADRASRSESCTKCATPDFAPCTSAPPSPSKSTSSCVTVFTTLGPVTNMRSEEHTSELQSLAYLVCRLLLEKKKKYFKSDISARTNFPHRHKPHVNN